MTMDLKQYRQMDLIMLSLLAAAAQVLGTYLHNILPGAGYYLNFAVLITLVAIYRWGSYGALVLIVSGIPMVLIGANTIGINIMLHVMAPSIIVLVAVVLQKQGPEKILNDTLQLFLLVLGTYGLLAVGQGLAVLLLGESPLSSMVMYFLSNGFNLIMTYIVLLLVRKRQGLMIDMKTYFEREQNNHEYSS